MSLAVSHAVKMNNGLTVPALGFGTWQAPPGVVGAALKQAIAAGFRHIDCAMVYRNEDEIGRTFQSVFSEGAVKREDLFVTSKLWNTNHRPEHVEEACRRTLADLQLEYLDLYLIHWPVNLAHVEATETVRHNDPTVLFPQNKATGTMLLDKEVDLLATWAAMEKLVDAKLVRSIGISNFSPEGVRQVCEAARIKPVTNQIEAHVALPQTDLKKVQDEFGIVTTAYCPLGIGMDGVVPMERTLLSHPRIVEIAEKAKMSPGHLLLSWNVQSGNVPLSKSVTPARIAENAAVQMNALSAEIMAELNEFGAKNPLRVCNPAFWKEDGTKFWNDFPQTY